MARQFEPVGAAFPFRELEERQRAFWRERDIFRRSVAERPADKLFSFYEGPPTANGRPGVHHVLARVFKDLFLRYKTMRGYRAPRKGGWDTHGLPVELEVEHELGLGSKAEIEAYGIAAFNRRCRESVMRYVRDWEDLTERIAFWIDMEEPYATYDPQYVESCWWIFKTLWQHGLIYEARRTTPHCPRCETSLSSHELALGYRENTPDPSIFVKFRAQRASLPAALREFEGETYLVAWTTTPWTLAGNTALAIAPDAAYVVVAGEAGERLLLAEERLAATFAGLAEEVAPSPLATLPGRELVGLAYEGLYEPDAWGVPILRFRDGQLEPWQREAGGALPRRVVAADFVSLEEGSGIVHIAPAFGEDDHRLGRQQDLLYVQPVDLKGCLTGERSPWRGLFVKDADQRIMTDLQDRGLLLKRETIRHTYPFCWRCETPLLYYAKPSWYIATTQVADTLIRSNREQMHWYPSHIRDGRYGDWLAHNVDWAISRERYWGTPLPFWRCQTCAQTDAVGSFDELRQRARDGADLDLSDPHRPGVDAIVLDCPACGGAMRRVPEVADAWFDSGAMPYAQWHYPFENREAFAAAFPADFICEAVDQTRGWFYSLHAEAALLHAAGQAPAAISYRHVLSPGHILDERGEKMSKSRNNVVDPWEVLDERGADALRWYLYAASPAGQPRRFSSRLVGAAQRKFLRPLWNTYAFFVTYANIDHFDPASPAPAALSELDHWIRGALQSLIVTVTAALERYDPTAAARAIEEFVDQLSNWYVRRSRRRFWKSEDDEDKAAAYHTLYECLTTLAGLLAPFAPYLAETIYRNLVRPAGAAVPESVHLAAWPEPDHALIDRERDAAMRLVQRLASLGHAARSKAGVKVRQPLPEVIVSLRSPAEAAALRPYETLLREELNVKRLTVAEAGAEQGDIRIKPNLPLLGPRLGGELARLRTALLALETEMAAQIAAALAEGSAVEIAGITLAPAELLVERQERAGATAASDAHYTVALRTALTPALRREGTAREVVHRVQGLRRRAGFEIADRIRLSISAAEAPAVVQAVRAHRDYVAAETLASHLEIQTAPRPPAADATSVEEVIDGETLRLSVQRL